MRIIEFVQTGDPARRHRVGAALPRDARTLVDLQAAHFAMTGRPATMFQDLDALAKAGEAGVDLATRVLAWVDSQRPPGTTTDVDAVRVLGQRDA